jgi:hypothetical protein
MATLNDLARVIAAHRLGGDTSVPQETFDALTKFTASVIEQRFGVPTLPNPGETVAVALSSPKTAALFFDRVWSIPGAEGEPPDSVGIYGATSFEIWAIALFALASEISLLTVEQLYPDSPTAAAHTSSRIAARDIANALAVERQIHAVPIYDDALAYSNEYKPGKYEVLIAALTALQIPDESLLSWDQVAQFRSDQEAKAAYRRLIHWADKELDNKSVRFIEDELAIRLDSYTAGLRKHGIQTALGAVEAMLEPVFVLGASAVVSALAFGGSLTAAELSGAALFGGKLACKLTRSFLDIADAKRGTNSEIAFLYRVSNTAKPVSTAG